MQQRLRSRCEDRRGRELAEKCLLERMACFTPPPTIPSKQGASMALISPPTTMPFTVPSWHPLLAYVRSTFQMLAPCSVALLLQGHKIKVPRFLQANLCQRSFVVPGDQKDTVASSLDR